MIKTYKITFKPVEPYFFGNEKNFTFPGQKQKSAYASSYFIRSEKAPSQSTVLGALRYIFLPHKKADYSYLDNEKIDNENAIGKASFDVDYVPENSSDSVIQNFGIIKKVSPVFICGQNNFGENVTLIPTPMDHNGTVKKSARTHRNSDKKILQYLPLSKYTEVNTTEGKKLYSEDFDVKKGIECSYVSLENSEIYTINDLFESDLRVGINRAEKKDGFFKKEYCMLRKGFSFAVYAELDTDNPPQSECVFLGQGKSSFAVTFTEEANNLENRVKEFLGKEDYKRVDFPFIYCLGDSFVSDFDDESVLFCALDVKDYRSFKSKEKGRVEKGGVLYRVLKAGSIIITENPKEWVEKNMKENANKIGFNTYVILGGK